MRGLSPEDRRELFKTVLVTDELCKSVEEADNVANDLMANSKDWKSHSNLSDSNLCEVYIILWIKKFSKVFLTTLKHYIKHRLNIILIDKMVQLKEVEDMTEEVFGRIFQPETKKAKSDTSVLPNISGWKFDILKENIKKPILLYNANGVCNVGKTTRSWNPVAGWHVRIKNVIDDATTKYFLHHVLGLVWLLMLSNLSQGCNEAILNYLSGTANTPRFPQRSTNQFGKVRAGEL